MSARLALALVMSACALRCKRACWTMHCVCAQRPPHHPPQPPRSPARRPAGWACTARGPMPWCAPCWSGACWQGCRRTGECRPRSSLGRAASRASTFCCTRPTLMAAAAQPAAAQRRKRMAAQARRPSGGAPARPPRRQPAAPARAHMRRQQQMQEQRRGGLAAGPAAGATYLEVKSVTLAEDLPEVCAPGLACCCCPLMPTPPCRFTGGCRRQAARPP